MIKDIRALPDNTQDATHCMAIYSGTHEFIMHKSPNKTYMSDEQPHAMELCSHTGIIVSVEGLEGECLPQMCRCSGSLSGRGGDGRNERVWVMQCPGRCCGAQNGQLTWQLRQLVKVKVLNKTGAVVESRLSLAFTTIHQTWGDFDPVLKFVQVRIPPAAIALQDSSMGNIVSCVYIIPDIATRSETGDGRNERWIVNSHIDLVTWIDVYNLERENCILGAGRRNARRDFRSVTLQIEIRMTAHTQWTHSEVWSQLATMPLSS